MVTSYVLPSTLTPPKSDDSGSRSLWPSRDPSGESGGINLYSFVINNPINWVDPLGLKPCQAKLFFGHADEAFDWAEAAAAEIKRLEETYTLDGTVDNSTCTYYGTGSCFSQTANDFIPPDHRINNRKPGEDGLIYCNDLKGFVKRDFRDALNKLKASCDKCDCDFNDVRIEVTCTDSLHRVSAKKCLGSGFCGDGKKTYTFSCDDIKKDGYIDSLMTKLSNSVDNHKYGP